MVGRTSPHEHREMGTQKHTCTQRGHGKLKADVGLKLLQAKERQRLSATSEALGGVWIRFSLLALRGN